MNRIISTKAFGVIMTTEILSFELKQGHSKPAWIGYRQFSKSGKTVYFDGRVLKKDKE